MKQMSSYFGDPSIRKEFSPLDMRDVLISECVRFNKPLSIKRDNDIKVENVDHQTLIRKVRGNLINPYSEVLVYHGLAFLIVLIANCLYFALFQLLQNDALKLSDTMFPHYVETLDFFVLFGCSAGQVLEMPSVCYHSLLCFFPKYQFQVAWLYDVQYMFMYCVFYAQDSIYNNLEKILALGIFIYFIKFYIYYNNFRIQDHNKNK